MSRISGAPDWISPCVPADRRRGDRARDGADGAAELGREVGGRQRAGALGGLDDDRRGAERGDDAVAGDEAPAVRLGAGRQLGDHRAALGDRRVQPPPPRRIGDVRAGREHADRAARRLERAGVRRGVDRPARARRRPARRAADSPRPSARATSSPYDEARRAPTTATRRSARSAAGSPEHVQHRGRVGEVAQPLGVGVATAADGRQAGRASPARGPRGASNAA